MLASCQQSGKVLKATESSSQPISWIENNLTPANSLEGHDVRLNLSELMKTYKIPGVSMAFVDEGQIAWNKSYGYADLAKKSKVTARTVFTGASLSKPLTSIAALKLVEAHKLNLDDPINSKLIDWKIPENEYTREQAVTLRMLLGHTAGVRNDLWASYLPEQSVPSLVDLLAGNSPSDNPPTEVVFLPGSKEKYSNPGYSIVQKAIEDVTRQTFESALNELVFKPSNMQESSFEQPIPEYLRREKAIGYNKDMLPFSYKIFPYKAAGGVWTTPSDIAKFVITLFKDLDGAGNILSKSMVQKIFSETPDRLAFAKIFAENSNDLIFRHYGTNQGFSSYVIGSVKKRQAFVVMTNGHMEFEFLDYLARAVAEYYQWEGLEPKKYSPIHEGKNLKSQFSGTFELDEKRLSFSVKNGNLTLTIQPQNLLIKLVQVSSNEFIDPATLTKYQFLKARNNSDGRYVWLRITQPGGMENYANRGKA